jgi:long-chain acyl-CoA synthetase
MAKFATMVELLDSVLKAYPERELFGTKTSGTWRWTTYQEFGGLVARARAALAELGVARGDNVAIIANNRVEWAVLQYACFGLGAAYVPMYEAQSSKDWSFILDDCNAKLVICATDAIVNKVRTLELKSPPIVLSLDDATTPAPALPGIHSYAEVMRNDPRTPSIAPEPGDLACLIYTSGTTGNPKGVMLTHGNIAANVSACREVLFIDETDRSLSFLPWAHVFGQSCELHLLLSRGASMALCEAIDKLLENLVEVRPTFLMSVPRIFNKIYTAVQKQIAAQPRLVREMVERTLALRTREREGTRLKLGEKLLVKACDKLVFEKVRARFGGRLRFAVSGGAALSPDVAKFISGIGITVFEGYGLTETAPVVSVNFPGNMRIGSVGKVLPGVRVEISAEQEIIVYGASVMKGYFNREAETQAVFLPDGGFRTGDMGKVQDGYLYITGRIKEQYKLENGKYVVPTPLEETLKLSPYVLNACVYGDNKPYNVALIVPNFDALSAYSAREGLHIVDNAALLKDSRIKQLIAKDIERVAASFKGFEGIKTFALVADDFTTENGMLTPSMKLKRKRVLEVHGAAIEALYTSK